MWFRRLIAGPETVMQARPTLEVLGGEMSDACEFGSLDDATKNCLCPNCAQHADTACAEWNRMRTVWNSSI
jgi:hypothetical protein